MGDRNVPLTELLSKVSINLEASATGRDDAIRQAGAGLLAAGAVDATYLDAMIDRENSVSTFMGDGVAFPHGTLAAKRAVTADALSFVRFPDGVDWDGNDVRLAFGIAAMGNGHIALLSQLASVLMHPGRSAALRAVTTMDEVFALLEPPAESGTTVE